MAAAAAQVGLEQIFAAQHERVFRAAYRITGNAMDAEDVLQTVFLRLLRQGWTAAAVGNVTTYVHRAAVNAALDVLRSRRNQKQTPLGELENVLSENPDAQLRLELRSALAQLSPRAAEMFALRYFEGYDNPEIARMLGSSVGNVAVTLHRTREQLQQAMRSSVGDPL
jgi:RNA polymerase sigma-70 factor, ECF subfamily